MGDKSTLNVRGTAVEDDVLRTKLAVDSRPPVYGMENKVPYQELGKGNPSLTDSATRMTFIKKLNDYQGYNKGESLSCNREAEGSDSTTPQMTEHGTPTYIQWAQDLQNLLNDEEGVELFKNYLIQENCDDSLLQFWFACEGMKKMVREKNFENMNQLIKVIYKTYINEHSQKCVAISSETRKNITELYLRNDHSHTLFDVAQCEVENHMKKAIYPNFLQSDLYLRYIQLQNRDCFVSGSPRYSAYDCISSSPDAGASYLATVHEDSESTVESSKNVFRLTSERLKKRWQKETLKDRSSTFEHSTVYPPSAASSHTKNVNFPSQPPNPYHVTYASYLPVSAQDSELQSMSSGAQTDDAVSVSASSSERKVPIRSTKSCLQKQQSVLRQHVSCNTIDCHLLPFIPRIHQGKARPEGIDPTRDPAGFAMLLTEKLNSVIQSSNVQSDKNTESVHGLLQQLCMINKSSASQPHGLERLPVQESDDDQSILDQHVSRIWSNQQTPVGSRTPKDFRTPGNGSFDPPEPTYSKNYPTLQRHSLAPSRSKECDENVSSVHEQSHGATTTNVVPQSFGSYNMFDKRLKDPDKRVVSRKSDVPPKTAGIPHSSSHERSSLSERDIRHGRTSNPSRKNPKKSSNTVHGSSSSISSSTSVKSSSSSSQDFTVIRYKFSNETEPFKVKLAGKNITLKQFKSVFNKKGNFRYYFKTLDEEFGECMKVEVNDDSEICPLWEGKIFADIHVE